MAAVSSMPMTVLNRVPQAFTLEAANDMDTELHAQTYLRTAAPAEHAGSRLPPN